ncbi:MAG: flavodoxin domain-containing protein [Anaerovoracaceae bacterium]
MGKVVVVYHSKYGSTQRYAEMIKEATGCDIVAESDCKVEDIMGYDTIVYGGAIHGGGILGLDFLKKNISALQGKKILAFAVGLNVLEQKNRDEVIELNFVKKLKGIPCYFCRGAYDPTQIKGMDKMLMKMVYKMVVKMPAVDRTLENSDLILAIEEGRDFVDKSYIEPILEAISK